MLKKRDFLKNSAVAASSAFLLPPTQADSAMSDDNSSNNNRQPTIDVVLFDQRFADSVAFGKALTELGARSYSTAPDIGQLWYRELAGMIASRSIRLAGLTQAIDLFLVQTLARDSGLNLLYRGNHDCQSRQSLNHQLTIEKSCRGILKILAQADEAWPHVLANILSQLQLQDSSWQIEQISTTTQRSKDNPGLLVSWVLG